MRLLCPTDPSLSIPIRVGSGPSEVGPRLGGRAPGGVRPEGAPRSTYLMTLPLSSEPELDASVFLSFDFDGMADGAGILKPNGLVTVLPHPPSRRAHNREHASSLSEHPLILGAISSDKLTSDTGMQVTKSSHKIGGRPFLMHGEPEIETDVGRAYRSGFRQLVQLAFPGGSGDAVVSGDWPFGDGLLHIFVHAAQSGLEFLRFWEF
jgi:hypothetical protein